MILIADSGSTKVDWSVIDNGMLIKSAQTKGINPYFQTEEEISDEIKNILLPQLDQTIFENIYFYGAGCTPEKINTVKTAIEQNFTVHNSIEVNSDILAAAHALCGHTAGIACIMGTGSNSCYYDGKIIIENVSPLGFILGDEGSGAVLSRLFLSELLKNQLTPSLKEKFLEEYNLTVAEIIENIYRKPFPNRYLAQFTKFISEHKEEPSVRKIIKGSFDDFIRKNVMQYQKSNELAIHFIGSIAYYFKDILIEVLEERGLTTGNIMKSPMEGLIKYHSK